MHFIHFSNKPSAYPNREVSSSEMLREVAYTYDKAETNTRNLVVYPLAFLYFISQANSWVLYIVAKLAISHYFLKMSRFFSIHKLAF